jgi:hypothetical protein
MEQVRKFHNQIKDDLIQRYLSEKRVGDFGFGFGGDIHKYDKANVSRVLAVEPSAVNLAEARKRLLTKSRAFQSKVTLIQATAQDTKAVMKGFAQTREAKVDAGASFFSLTFLFESEAIMDAFITTLKMAVRTGGHVVGTCMDASRTTAFLRQTPTGQSLSLPGVYTFTKEYTDNASDASGEEDASAAVDTPRHTFGQVVKVHLDNTIVSEQVEYLAWFDLWQSKMEANGFRLIESNYFAPPESWPLAHFSRLFRTFVFVKDRLPTNPNAITTTPIAAQTLHTVPPHRKRKRDSLPKDKDAAAAITSVHKAPRV